MVLKFLFTVFSTVHSQEIAQGSQYLSREDANSTIKRIAVGKASDNANKVYAKPLRERLIELIDEDHRFDRVDGFQSTKNVDQLVEQPREISKQLKLLGADALLNLKAIRSPSGMQLVLRLHRQSDGMLFLEQEKEEIQTFDFKTLNRELAELYNRLISAMPYQGMILSRRGKDVTINLGKLNGITAGDEITAVQIVGFNRHPKFQFVINSKKELLGTLKVTKSDKRLSFAKIVSERAAGAIRVDTKIETKPFTRYSELESALSEVPSLFGRDAKEWVPEKPPSFGRLMAGFGLGRYSGALNGTYDNGGVTESKNIDSISSFVPSINLEGEIWVNPQWLLSAGLSQGIVNTLADGKNLNIGTSKWSFDAAYNLLFTDSFFGPKMSFSLGFLSYEYNVDETGLDGLTNLKFSGWGFGISGSFPISRKTDKWSAGGKFTTFLTASMKESPRTSGKSKDARINDFGVFLGYKLSERIRIRTELNFELYSSEFSGTGSRQVGSSAISGESASNRFTTLALGVNYLF